jgi:hypothetical protein
MRRFSQMMTKYQVMTPKRRFAPRLVSRVEDALSTHAPPSRHFPSLPTQAWEAGWVARATVNLRLPPSYTSIVMLTSQSGVSCTEYVCRWNVCTSNSCGLPLLRPVGKTANIQLNLLLYISIYCTHFTVNVQI